MVYQDNSLSIGRTPLVRLNRVTEGTGATVLAKIRGTEPRILGEMPNRRSDDLGRRRARALKPGKGTRLSRRAGTRALRLRLLRRRGVIPSR